MVGERKIENRIYISRKKKVAGALIVIQYLVSCWQIELYSLERFDISQAKCWIFSSWHKKKKLFNITASTSGKIPWAYRYLGM